MVDGRAGRVVEARRLLVCSLILLLLLLILRRGVGVGVVRRRRPRRGVGHHGLILVVVVGGFVMVPGVEICGIVGVLIQIRSPAGFAAAGVIGG